MDFHCCVGLFFNFYSRVEVEYLSSSNLTKLFFIVGWWIGNVACCSDAGFVPNVILARLAEIIRNNNENVAFLK